MTTPERLGSYRIVGTVASRAFSVTYRARHEVLGRPALLRALKPAVSPSSPAARAVEREAAILARIRHPSIVDVLEIHRSDEAVWFTMADPEGHRLTTVLERTPKLASAPALAVTLGLARGLAVAHQVGIVHRCLQPSVVELTPQGNVVMMDFAFAREALGAVAPEIGEIGEKGALDRLAPEQLKGDEGGPQSDVYALGHVLFEMLTGESPLAASKAGGEKRGSPRPLTTLLPDATKSLERLVARCLAKDPDDRFADAAQLALALEEELRSRTRAPVEVLVSRALAAAKLAPELPLEERRVDTSARGSRFAGPAAPFLALFGALVLVALGSEIAKRSEGPSPQASAEAVTARAERGSLRVLARPWADVFVDGEHVETTPFARPVPLTVGKHVVTLRHPVAPDESRAVEIAAGQTLSLDVTMRVVRSTNDGGARADASGEDP